MCKCLTLGLHPFQISKNVLEEVLDENLFKTYTVVSLQNFKRRLELLIILLTMSIFVLFPLFLTPFFYGVPGIVHYAIMPSSLRNFVKGLGICPFYVYLPQYCPPYIKSYNFFLSIYLFTFALQILKASNASSL